MQAIERVEIHYICQMHKTVDKHCLFPRKIVYIKGLSSISLVNKVGQFKIFREGVKSQVKNVCDKAGAAEDKIDSKYRHHLFFVKLEVK